ncbi:MAG: hypothetical protein ACFFA2_12335 [Promethearchaeota archaeon]
MEESPVEKKIVRIDQVYVVGGSFDDPSDFTNKVNRNLVILHESNKYYKIKDIKFNIFNDQRYPHSTPIYLAFIVAEVDVDVTPEPEKKRKKKKKKKKKRS